MIKFKMAVCQNKPARDKAASIFHAVEMIEKAAKNGAELIVLPEIFYHPYELENILELTEEADDSETLDYLKDCARRLKIHLCAGSMAIRDGNEIFNRSYLISPEGKILLKHDKCHLFDVNFKELKVKESSFFSPGNALNVVETELGKIGILICYDIRFPEAARMLALAGAEILLVPAVFNTVTGPAHWNLLFRTRAVENQIYVAAASPARDNDALYQAYGHSMIIDPWGEIMTEAETDESIIYSDVDPGKMNDIRGRLPLLKHRRKELYAK